MDIGAANRIKYGLMLYLVIMTVEFVYSSLVFSFFFILKNILFFNPKSTFIQI